ncbi:hypothetical protein D3C72_1775200 [compost metagenome]
MGDDDAVHVGLLGQCRDALTQLEEMLVGEALRCDLEHLFARYLGHIGQLWQTRQQLVHGHLGSGIGGAVGGRCARTGNGAARGQHHHVGLGRLGHGDGGGCGQQQAGEPAVGGL